VAVALAEAPGARFNVVPPVRHVGQVHRHQGISVNLFRGLKRFNSVGMGRIMDIKMHADSLSPFG
jgi:hypothetical protein